MFTTHQLGADQVWPAAIGISVVGPFALVPAYLMALCPAHRHHAGCAWLGTLALTLLADVLGSVRRPAARRRLIGGELGRRRPC